MGKKLEADFVQSIIQMHLDKRYDDVIVTLQRKGLTLEQFKHQVWMTALTDYLERCSSGKLKGIVAQLFQHQVTPLQHAKYKHWFPASLESAIKQAIQIGDIPGPVNAAIESEELFKLAASVSIVRGQQYFNNGD